jgi:hypothetical protein
MKTVVRINKIAPNYIGACPIGAAIVDTVDRRMWIEQDDFVVVRVLEQGEAADDAEIELSKWDDECERLAQNINSLCYDNDPDIRFGEDTNPIAEIYWAVLYRGGLNVLTDKALVLVKANEVNRLWTGDPRQLPLSIVEDNMPEGPDAAPDPHYEHVGDARTIHAALLAGGDSVSAGRDDDAFEGNVCYFEWRDPDESKW